MMGGKRLVGHQYLRQASHVDSGYVTTIGGVVLKIYTVVSPCGPDVKCLQVLLNI
jgi:hypothetical protein